MEFAWTNIQCSQKAKVAFTEQNDIGVADTNHVFLDEHIFVVDRGTYILRAQDYSHYGQQSIVRGKDIFVADKNNR